MGHAKLYERDETVHFEANLRELSICDSFPIGARVAIALCFVPPEDVVKVFDSIQWKKNTTALRQFFDYFEVLSLKKTS